MESGETLSENIAILDWTVHQADALKPKGSLGHTQLLEALAFISTEIHKVFKPFFAGVGDDEKTKAAETIGKRMDYLVGTMRGDYPLSDTVSVADFYLFVMLLWAAKNDLDVPSGLAAYPSQPIVLPSLPIR